MYHHMRHMTGLMRYSLTAERGACMLIAVLIHPAFGHSKQTKTIRD